MHHMCRMQKQGKNFICISGTLDHKTQENLYSMISEKMCPLLSANCRMYPFYYQVSYWPLVDCHAFLHLVTLSVLRTKMFRDSRLLIEPSSAKERAPPLLWHGLSILNSSSFLWVPYWTANGRLSLSPWHCLSTGCGWRTWPPGTEGSCKYIE
jgi:hypothetical protein